MKCHQIVIESKVLRSRNILMRLQLREGEIIRLRLELIPMTNVAQISKMCTWYRYVLMRLRLEQGK
jgi:hypothetical protein